MINAMILEIKYRVKFNKLKADPVETIYFGGGTPSLLSEKNIMVLFETIYTYFDVLPGAEITFEVNPDDVTESTLKIWKRAGINRLSLGIQSFLSSDLKWMNRPHDGLQAELAIKAVKEAGFHNFSGDLIFGSPLLSDKALKKNIDILTDLNVPHIAAYALTVEPLTPLEKMIRLKNKEPVDSAKQASQFSMLMDWLKSSGYEHYEISNFCLPGNRSRHNSSYWQGKPYIGIGPSAHSYDGMNRSWNISNNWEYINNMKKGKPVYGVEKLGSTQRLNEYIMMSLRTMEGLDLYYIKNNFGKKYSMKVLEDAGIYITNQSALLNNNHLILTQKGKLFADRIASDLFFI